MLQDFMLEEDDVFVSYDVTALFMSMHYNKVVEVAVERANNDRKLQTWGSSNSASQPTSNSWGNIINTYLEVLWPRPSHPE